jgi:predicted N-formylglutamate amidohydrolase
MIEKFLSVWMTALLQAVAVQPRAADAMLQSIEAEKVLLSPGDPDPVEIVNPDGASVFVLTCEHAGKAVPASLGDLGVAPAEMARHVACDIGAESLSRRLSGRLDAPLVMQRYSRLVVDCNRPFYAADCFPAVSDGTRVPANANLTDQERRRRFKEIHQPFHDMIAGHLEERAAAKRPTILVSVHSFTPCLVGGPDRPWQLGVLSNRDARFAKRFLATFRSTNPDISSERNEPYLVDDQSDYTIPVHGEARGLPHLLLEIRNDLILDTAGQDRWADLVADALTAALETEKDSSHGR